MRKKVSFILFIIVFFMMRLIAQNDTKVEFEGKTYFMDIRASNGKADIWFTEKRNASSVGDKKILTLKVINTSLQQATQKFCQAKEIMDNGKTIVGCLSIVGAAGCAMATIATEGATAALCTTTWAYAESQGIKDCILGVSDIIAGQLKKNPQWIVFKGAANLTDKNYEDLIDNAIEALCKLNGN